MNKTEQKAKTAAGDMAKECLAMRTRLLNRTLTSIYDDMFRPLGITAAQVNLLAAITCRPSLTPGDLASMMNMEKSTVSRNLERMEKTGWIKITRESSGKQHYLELTQDGNKLLGNAHPLWKKAQNDTRDLLGKQGAISIQKIGDHLRK
jgi:DNA-binding MarR family transcriptional regulator